MLLFLQLGGSHSVFNIRVLCHLQMIFSQTVSLCFFFFFPRSSTQVDSYLSTHFWFVQACGYARFKAFLVALAIKNLSAMQETRRHVFHPWVMKIPRKRKWHPALVILPIKSHGQRCLEGYSPWGPQKSQTRLSY